MRLLERRSACRCPRCVILRAPAPRAVVDLGPLPLWPPRRVWRRLLHALGVRVDYVGVVVLEDLDANEAATIAGMRGAGVAPRGEA